MEKVLAQLIQNPEGRKSTSAGRLSAQATIMTKMPTPCYHPRLERFVRYSRGDCRSYEFASAKGQ